MKNELRAAGSRFSDAVIDFLVLPLLDPFRFPFGEIASHGEWCIGHVDRIFLVGFVFA